ncbi:hypothetical protein B0H14DRAFT_2590927 [Mycena olivaceomarginata]|nr:hypothetical protein B0H14DRAFT_2590927 [Mycena olivaceomarginata]
MSLAIFHWASNGFKSRSRGRCHRQTRREHALDFMSGTRAHQALDFMSGTNQGFDCMSTLVSYDTYETSKDDGDGKRDREETPKDDSSGDKGERILRHDDSNGAQNEDDGSGGKKSQKRKKPAKQAKVKVCS